MQLRSIALRDIKFNIVHEYRFMAMLNEHHAARVCNWCGRKIRRREYNKCVTRIKIITTQDQTRQAHICDECRAETRIHEHRTLSPKRLLQISKRPKKKSTQETDNLYLN